MVIGVDVTVCSYFYTKIQGGITLKKEDLIAKGLSEEQAEAVLEIYNTEIKEYVPKADYDSANRDNNALKDIIKDRDKQLTTLKKSVGDNEELKKQIETLQNENKDAAEKHNAEVRSLKIDNAVETALITSRAKTSKAVRALLDMDKIDIDKAGNVTGIEDQIKALVEGEDTKYLFESAPTLKGTQLGYGVDDKPKDVNDINDMNYTELCAYIEANPDAKI